MARGSRKARGFGSTSRGTRGGDLHRDKANPNGEVVHVEHPDQGKTLCRKCKAEITVVQIGHQRWQQRDLDGVPHALTCKGKS